MDKDKQFLIEANDVSDSVSKVIRKHSARPSILNSKENINNKVFCFFNVCNVTYEKNSKCN